MSKVRVTTGILEGKLGDTHGSFVSSEDYFDLVQKYKQLKTDLIAEERANCVSMDTEMKLKDTITALKDENAELLDAVFRAAIGG